MQPFMFASYCGNVIGQLLLAFAHSIFLYFFFMAQRYEIVNGVVEVEIVKGEGTEEAPAEEKETEGFHH